MRLRSDVELRPGDAGTAQTIVEMRTLARQGAQNPRVRAVAAWCDDMAGSMGPPVTARSRIPAVIRHVCSCVDWLPDDDAAAAYGVGGEITELVRAPWLVLDEGAGDCDDVATLGASLALALGLRTRFVTVGPPGGPFIHVYAEVLCCPRYGWQELDTTRDVQGLPANWGDWRRRTWPV